MVHTSIHSRSKLADERHLHYGISLSLSSSHLNDLTDVLLIALVYKRTTTILTPNGLRISDIGISYNVITSVSWPRSNWIVGWSDPGRERWAFAVSDR